MTKKFTKTLFRSVLEELHKDTNSIRQMCSNTHLTRKAIEGELFRISQVTNMEYWMRWDRKDSAQITIPLRTMPIDTLEWLIKSLYKIDVASGKEIKTQDDLPDGILPI
jgi:hypothetical protein